MASEYELKKELLTRRLVDKIAGDASFRDAMVTKPAETLAAAGFTRELQELNEVASGEVAGYVSPDYTLSWGCITTVKP